MHLIVLECVGEKHNSVVTDAQEKTKVQSKPSVRPSHKTCFLCDGNHFMKTFPMKEELESHLGEAQGKPIERFVAIRAQV